ncbi:MAG: TerB N-terminal domain-containing protein [Clostridia bacterium]|nr:TerB N-terminal domain-containing protein [Clostridia bacterium]
MPENRTPEELAELAKEIRRRVEEAVRKSAPSSRGTDGNRGSDDSTARTEKIFREIADAAGRIFEDDQNARASRREPDPRTSDTTPIELQTPAPNAGTVPTGERLPESRTTARDDDFWDLGKPKPRIYEKPDFSRRRVGVTDVNAPDPEPAAGERIASAETIVKDDAPLRDPGRFDTLDAKPSSGGSSGRVIRTADGYRSVPTGSYRRHTPPRPPIRQADRTESPRRRSAGSVEVKNYSPGGKLIRTVSVRTWESDTEFYNRFLADAARSHETPCPDPETSPEPVPYSSFVPQYAHMNLNQLNYYRWMRENIRRGITPAADFSYVLLYIYEILNLPDRIPPERGAELLSRIWLGYRGAYPRLDGSLCEWLPDYCLIHGIPMPAVLEPILPEIVPKAQLKEFWLDRAAGDADCMMLARAILETSSDYNYRTSRYYADRRDDYEKHIPAAIAKALAADREANRGLFALDKVYQMTRDSYVGAVAASSVKRRIDLSFVSLTRRADSRPQVTAAVKYAENKLRAVLGIKAKLGADGVSEENARAIDAWFAPFLPTREQIRQKKEDAYMPPDYLKNYEAEDTGFDPDAAAAIEAKSWANTSRLTGDDYGADPAETEIPPESSESPWEETVEVEGEIGSETACGIPAPASEETNEETDPGNPAEESPCGDGSGDEILRDALRAAMNGRFRGYCREHGLYEGDAADRINALFLESIGDVVLEADADGGFRFVEDYREDAEEWLR